MEARFEQKQKQKEEGLKRRSVWARRRIISKVSSNRKPPRVSLNLRTATLKRPYLILPMLTRFGFWILWLLELYLASPTVTLAKFTVPHADDVNLFHWSVALLWLVKTDNICILFIYLFVFLLIWEEEFNEDNTNN